MAKKKPADDQQLRPAALNGLLSHAPSDEAGRERYPNLTECLYPIWKEGKCLRHDGYLRISLEGPYYLLTLCCPAEGVECRARVSTLLDCLDELEAVLRGGGAAWVPDYKHRK